MAFLYSFMIFIGLLKSSLYATAPCLIGEYMIPNGSCVDCSPGTYGSNCSMSCEKGKYGLKCAHVCNCTDCDPVTGCPLDANETTISADNTTVLHPDILVFYIVSSTFGFLLLFTLICCLSKRKKDRLTESDTVAENVSTGRSDNPTYDHAGIVEDPYSFSNGTEYNTLQFAGLRRYNGANIASASIYGVGQFGSDMPENGAYDMGLTLNTVDEMRHKVTEGATNSPSDIDIYGNYEDNPYMNFGGSETSPYELAHNVS